MFHTPGGTRNRKSLDRIALLVTLLLCGSGCRPSGPELPTPEAPSPAAWEDWDVLYIHGDRVGYSHTVAYEVQQGPEKLLRIESETELEIVRFGQRTAQSLQLTSIETPDGAVRSFHSILMQAAVPMVTSGRVENGRMVVKVLTAGKTTTTSQLAWSADIGGFFAVEQSLVAQPMKPGERRRLQTLVPVFNQVATVEMVARDYEPTPLLAGDYRLLRIDSSMTLPGAVPIESTFWTDRTGQAMKTEVAALEQVSYRTTRQIALKQADGDAQAEWDLGKASLVKLAQPLPHAHATREVRYRVKLDGSDPARAFVTGASQHVESKDLHTAEVVVRAIDPTTDLATGPWSDGVGSGTAAGDEDIQPNALIQSDDPRIVAMAADAAPSGQDAWQTSLQLEKYVHEKMENVNFTQAFATAAEVAQSLEGDCTEHAVLLAALARARGIPARVAIGLVYLESSQGFFYHMWTEVFVQDRWIAIDATLGRGGIGAGHLKLAHSNLNGAAAYCTFLPVLQILGRLKIEVIEAESASRRDDGD